MLPWASTVQSVSSKWLLVKSFLGKLEPVAAEGKEGREKGSKHLALKGPHIT